MPRSERAKQFMPFDALKGLQDALRLKEYNHEKIAMGDLSEETVLEISNTLGNLKNRDIVEAEIIKDGHKTKFSGKVKLEFENQRIFIEQNQIDLKDLIEIKKLS